MNFEVNEALSQDERREKALTAVLTSLSSEQDASWTYSEA